MIVVRCPVCGSTSAGGIEAQSAYDLTYMACGACGEGGLKDHWQIKFEWNIELDHDETTPLPPYVIPFDPRSRLGVTRTAEAIDVWLHAPDLAGGAEQFERMTASPFDAGTARIFDSIDVRRYGPYVLWLADGWRASFDAADYAATLGGDAGALPLHVDAALAGYEPVAPPPRAAAIAHGRYWFARGDDGRWVAQLHRTFALPVWVRGPRVDEIAIEELDVPGEERAEPGGDVRG